MPFLASFTLRRKRETDLLMQSGTDLRFDQVRIG